MNRASALSALLPFVLLVRFAAAQEPPRPAPLPSLPPPVASGAAEAAPAPPVLVPAPVLVAPSAAAPSVSAPSAGAPPTLRTDFLPASPATDAEADEPARPEGPPRFTYLRASMGMKVGAFGDAGLDAFASDDVVPSWSVDVSYTLFVVRRFSVAAGLGWDVGGRASELRGVTKTSLVTHRFSVPIEGRYHFAGWLYAFGKLAPGAALHHVSVTDASSNDPLTDTLGGFSGEASLGASLLIGPHRGYDRRTVRFWVTPEMGYAWTTSAAVHATPNGNPNDVLGSNAPANFGSLAMRGIFWRVGFAVTF